MKPLSAVLLAIALFTVTSLPVWAQDTTPRAVIAKAIKALGGKAKLSKFKAVAFTDKGTFYGLGNAIAYTAEWKVQPPEQMRFDMKMSIMDQDISFLEVVTKTKGFKKINDQLMKMTADELKEKHEQLRVDYVTQLVPLTNPRFELSLIGEVDVKEKPAVGIRVAEKGHRDIQLFFDKKTHLLVKAEYEVNDPMAGGKQTQTVFYTNYKPFDGVPQPTSLLIERDGKRFVETEISDLQLLERFEAGAFEK